MGIVNGFMVLLSGLIGILIAYGVCSPILDVLIAYNMLLGGHPAQIAHMIEVVVYVTVPMMLIATYVIYAFISSTREEDNSRW